MRWLLALTLALLPIATVHTVTSASGAPLQRFITARGDQLFDGNQPFRFISVNIPNLQLVEDNFAPGAKTAWGWPNEFEMNDALESVRQMGGTVARTYVLSVRREGSDMGDHVYVRGPGDFNEEAFRTLDLALEIANRKGVRLIIPLVDNWKWQGGIAEYAAFRGKEPAAFWNDEQVIADFEQTVRHLLGRVNTRTGVAYRDDPAILGWETGNELDSPPEWTTRIAKLIKELDPNHLVIDGYSLHGVRDESLADPNVDVVTTHHYPNTDNEYVEPIVAAKAKSRGKKPYFVGEFGFIPPDDVERVYHAVIDNDVSGALLWSLRYHHRDGGFYWHSEPSGGRLYKAYHWPGFASGDPYQERRVMQMTRDMALKIRGVEPPAVESPAAPKLLPIADVAAIAWQGSAGAESYVVERAAAAQGPWTRIASGVDDAVVQYRPLFSDETAELGHSYHYRVVAVNEAGESTPSNTIGPVAVAHRTLVDECQDLSKAVASTDGVKPTNGDDRGRREDAHRLSIPAGGSVVYRVEAPINSWQAILFLPNDAVKVDASYSTDGKAYSPAAATATTEGDGQGDYGYLPQLTIVGTKPPVGAQFLKLTARDGDAELSRVEIRFGGK